MVYDMDNRDIRFKVKKYIESACKRLDRARYTQESAYVDAFIARLDGELNFGEDKGTINFTPTIVADRGAGSAESKYGADFAIVFESENIEHPIRKAIISQAKNCVLDKLSAAEIKRLNTQCIKMANITNDYIILEAPSVAGAIPTIKIGNPATSSWEAESISFDDYLLDHILSCQHGDRRPGFIDGVATSKLSGIRVDVNGIEYIPEVKPKNRSSQKPRNGGMKP